jgi:eukaryotic-like serine/threonine-protein kinase
MPGPNRGTGPAGPDGKGRVIAGRYSLDREIGRGGSGAVWLGRDDLLGRRVAIKRIGLLPGTDGTDVARAEREARLGARLHHPHVVAVFDVVADPDTDEHWLVMEYVEGTDLAALVATRGALPPDDAAPLLCQAADGLVAAHAMGITHRDVKPSNILVGADGTVKLTDFGIARVATDASLTQTGLVTGSPAYIAPEVASGGRGDEASDVWSLGATAYHVLAGRAPYEVVDHVLATLYRIVHDDPPRLGSIGWPEALLEGTMVRDPAQRWSMEQVRDFLARPDQRTTVPAPAPPRPESEEEGDTRLLTVARGAPEAAPPPAQDAQPERSRRPSALLLIGLGVGACLLLAVALRATLSGGPGTGDEARPSSTPTGTTKVAAAGPTARGIEAFIRDYVSTVSADPGRAWSMLTPKFQRESGGLDRYVRFWDSATNGKVLSITADPTNLSVSYQVHFDDFDNGPGPTVLDLVYEKGRYLIDGERTRGFVPAD